MDTNRTRINPWQALGVGLAMATAVLIGGQVLAGIKVANTGSVTTIGGGGPESDPVFAAVSNTFYLAANPAGYVTVTITNGLYPSSNPAGYISSYTETDPVFSAVSNTFYLAANPAGYVTGTITNGLYPASNPAGYITVAPLNATNALLSARIDELANTTWRDPVIDVNLTTPPGAPTTGDRYVVGAGASGAWAGMSDQIATWNGSTWDFEAPLDGWAVNEIDSGTDWRFNGVSWSPILGPSPAKSLSIAEIDGSPRVNAATKLEVSNGTLQSMGGGVARLTISGGGSTNTFANTNTLAGAVSVVGNQVRIGTNAPAADTFPSFWLPLGGAYTDFELKASTNNFQSLAYYYNSIWTNSIADDPAAKVFFTDSGAVNPRAWITSPGHTAILGQLTDTNSAVRYVVVQPSLLVISPGGVTNNVSAWMNKNQSNLVWSYSRIDGVTFETDGGARQIWTPVTPTWIPQRTTP